MAVVFDEQPGKQQNVLVGIQNSAHFERVQIAQIQPKLAVVLRVLRGAFVDGVLEIGVARP